VDAVATGAIGHRLRARPGRQAMEEASKLTILSEGKPKRFESCTFP